MSAEPVKSPAACAHLTVRVEPFAHGYDEGPYCALHRQWIVGGPRGTCVGCKDFAEPKP